MENKQFKILFFGDITGKPGRIAVRDYLLSLSENDYTEEEAYAVRNYKDCLKSRNNSLEKFEILKSNNSDFYDIQKEFNKACIYSSSIRYYEKNEHIKAIVKREKEKTDYLYKFKESAPVSYSIPKAETISDFDDQSIKPSVIKSVFLAILSLIVFYISFLIATLLFGFVLDFLTRLPLIGDFLYWTFELVDGAAIDAAYICSTVASYGAVNLCANILTKNEATALLAVKICSIALIAFNIFCLIANIIYGNNFFVNIITTLYGFVFLNYNRR